jgi:hypothetical protein
MNYLKITPWSLIFLLLTYHTSQAQTLGLARLSLTQGDVQIKAGESQNWEAADVNAPLQTGDRIWCPENTRAEIQLSDGSLLRLEHNSSLDILRLEANAIQFHLGMGNLYIKSSALNGKNFQVDLPDSTIQLGQHARFRVDLAEDGDAQISIFSGWVYVESVNNKTTVRTGEKLSLDENSADVSPLNPPDEWEQWNKTRDRQMLVRTTGAQYLPPELGVYAPDLEENGEWIDTPDYGYVWQPHTIIHTGWAPYHYGHWAWIGGDYVWISQEHWGWAPYHYGRWLQHNNNWCWLPPRQGDVFWGPGYVGWTWTRSHVAWVPLAPDEIYFGFGSFGPHSVNLSNGQTVEKITYRNASVQLGVTQVQRHDFLSGQYRPVNVRDNPFAHGKISGRPDFKPDRPGTFNANRLVPTTDRPVERIRQTNVQELQKQHPLIAASTWQNRPLHRQITRLPHDSQAEKWIEPEPVDRHPSHRTVRELERPSYQDKGSDRPMSRHSAGAQRGNNLNKRSWKVSPQDNATANGNGNDQPVERRSRGMER